MLWAVWFYLVDCLQVVVGLLDPWPYLVIDCGLPGLESDSLMVPCGLLYSMR